MQRDTILYKKGVIQAINIIIYKGTDCPNNESSWRVYTNWTGNDIRLKFKNKKEAEKKYEEIVNDFKKKGWKDGTPDFGKGWQKEED